MPFGSLRKDGSFFEPGLITKVEKQIKKRTRRVLKKRLNVFINILNETKKRVIKNLPQRNPDIVKIQGPKRNIFEGLRPYSNLNLEGNLAK